MEPSLVPPWEIPGPRQFTVPYGHAAGILANYALKKRRRMYEFGAGAEEYGLVAINARRWAALNPRAVVRQPLTMDDYLASRVIVDPLLLLDCDYPINGSCAVIFIGRLRQRVNSRTGARRNWAICKAACLCCWKHYCRRWNKKASASSLAHKSSA